MKLEISLKRVNELFSRFEAQVKNEASISKTDLNKTAETIFIPLFNEIYGWNLENVNYAEDDNNHPGIDLGDKAAKVCIQVTATTSPEKVKHTLRQFIKYEQYLEYDRLIVFLLKEKQGYQNKVIQAFQNIIQDKVVFDAERDIWDCRNLYREISNFQVERVNQIRGILEANFGDDKPTNPKQEINWRDTCQALLNQWKGLTTNALTRPNGVCFQIDDVFVPLGVVERQKKPRHAPSAGSPEQGSELYKENGAPVSQDDSEEKVIPISQDDFFETVLRHGQSQYSQGQRIAIIGEPGAGKTTQLQKIGNWILKETDGIPIWIPLSTLDKKGLRGYLSQDWLQTAITELEVTEHHRDDLGQLLKTGKVWLLLDGADELAVSNALHHIATQMREGWLQNVRVVLTCRLNVWEVGKNALDNFDVYRNLDFDYPTEVHQFVDNWFREELDLQQKLKAALEQPGKERIRDMVKNPLRLTLLCYSWQIRQGELPETKAGLYEWFVDVFYEWDKGKAPCNLTSEKRKELNQALGALARESIDKTSSRFRLVENFIAYFLGDVNDEGSLFHIALQLGWLNRVGVAEENPFEGVYAFLHPTFQEYFAALSIDNGHFFLNHITEDPLSIEASYRILHQVWRETYLLWLGVNSSDNSQKEELLNALVDFEEALEELSFYGIRTKLIAAYGLVEFRGFSRKQEIIDWLLDLSINEMEALSNPIASIARNLLKEMPGIILADAIAQLLRAENSHLQHNAAKIVGELKCSESQVVKALTELVSNTNFKDTRCDALCSLLKIDPTNAEAIDGLIQTLHGEGADASLGISAAQALRYAEVEQGKVIQALESCIQPQLSEQHSFSFPTYQDIACSAAFSLLNFDSENENAITVLRSLAQNHWSQAQRHEIVKALIKMEIEVEESDVSSIQDFRDVFQEDFETRLLNLGLSLELEAPVIIEKLVSIIVNEEEERIRKKAAWCLKLVFHDYLSSIPINIYPNLVSLLKSCIESLPKEEPRRRAILSIGTQDPFLACYEGLWSISEVLSFKEFYRAWNT